jgi:hypothetical protein
MLQQILSKHSAAEDDPGGLIIAQRKGIALDYGKR